MRRSRIRACVALCPAVLAVALAVPVGARAQAIEIITGGQARVVRGPGIRVIARVSDDLSETRVEAALPLSHAEVLVVQEALDARGYYPGPLDGLMGSQVRDAIDALRVDLGFLPCGCLDGPTLAALGIRARVMQTFIGTSPDDPPIEIIRPTRRVGGATGGRAVESVAPDSDPRAGATSVVGDGIPVIPILRPAARNRGVADSPRAGGGRRLGSGSGRLRRARPPTSRPPLR